MAGQKFTKYLIDVLILGILTKENKPLSYLEIKEILIRELPVLKKDEIGLASMIRVTLIELLGQNLVEVYPHDNFNLEYIIRK